MYRRYYGSWIGTGIIHLDGVQCNGSESTLLDCKHNPIGFHNCDHYIAGVTCLSKGYFCMVNEGVVCQ